MVDVCFTTILVVIQQKIIFDRVITGGCYGRIFDTDVDLRLSPIK